MTFVRLYSFRVCCDFPCTESIVITTSSEETPTLAVESHGWRVDDPLTFCPNHKTEVPKGEAWAWREARKPYR